MKKKVISKDNPALQFLSAAEPEPAALEVSGRDTLPEAPEGYELRPERKSKRVQLLFQPTLYAKIKAQADAHGESFNEYVHQLLSRALKEQ